MAPSKQLSLKTRKSSTNSKKNKAKAAIASRWKKKGCFDNMQSMTEENPDSNLDLEPSNSNLSDPLPGPSNYSVCNVTHTCDVRPTEEKEQSRPSSRRISELEISLETLVDENCVRPTEKMPDYKVVDMTCLSALFTSLACTLCENKSLVLKTVARVGFAHKLVLECSICECIIESCDSSKKISDSGRPKVYDVNRRMAKFFSSTGQGHGSMERFGMVFNMDSMSQRAYSNHVKVISKSCKQAAEISLVKARDRVREAYIEQDPGNKDKTYLDLSVSYDGTWQKRGHTSNFGVGVVIELYTGLVIDFCVMSKYCHECAITKKELGEHSPEFSIWYSGHASDCSINYRGSSGAMEVTAAEILWGRSQEYGFRYLTLLSDGDSKTFSHLQSLNIYGLGVELSKEECVNHVSKRLGTGLRKVVTECKAKKITLGGKKHGSLKESTIKKLTKYYHNSIIRNVNNVKGMKDDILATLHHCVSTDAAPRHFKCPKGVESWCFYNRALAKNENPGSHAVHVKTPISETVLKHIAPVYQRLSSYELLNRCTKGLTQNANESLNGMIWSKCPKIRNASKRTVENAVSEAVGEFNFGNTNFTVSMETASLSIGEKSLKIMSSRDKRRIRHYKTKSTKKFQEYRRKMRMQALKKEEELKEKEGLMYGAGEF